MNPIDLFSSSPLVHHWGSFALPDAKRTLFREFDRAPLDTKIVKQVLAFSEEQTKLMLDQIWLRFSARHNDVENFLILGGERALRRAGYAESLSKSEISKESILLLGAYSSREYATEAAALTNPSIILHPNQTALERGQTRVAISLRAIGEGHVSSIAFMTAILDPTLGPIASPRIRPQISGELSLVGEETLVNTELEEEEGILALDNVNNYIIDFSPFSDLSQRILYPRSESETMGMEDARFVSIVGDNGELEYRATYTAYNGENIHPRLIISKDLTKFTILDLTGPAATNKGMALFPEKINGRWVALCRGDGYTSSLSESEDGIFWETPVALAGEADPWDLLIAGNAGSPHLTSAGWLVITHGVGPMRTYSLGAMLLDREDPSKILGRLKGPLLAPNDEESIGYVPNAVYSCGSLIVGENLWLPYGVSDRCTSFASVNVEELIAEILK